MNRFQNTTLQDVTIISTLAQTHSGTTRVQLCRYQNELMVCKSILKASIVGDGKAIEHIKNQKDALRYFSERKCGYVCGFYGTFQDEEWLYIMMEMVEGLPLHQLLKMMGPFTERMVKIICIQVAQILRRFHSQGYLYRDIKSSNFMLSKSGKIKLIDLGKAKKIGRERTSTICGTTHAMPPDIYRKNGYSYEFDYYGFGVLVYELLVGCSPFGYGGSNKNILEEVEVGLTSEKMVKIANPLAADLITRLMAKEPGQRLGNDGGFAQILKHQYFSQELEHAMKIFNGEQELSPFDEEFSELVSEIEDLGIDAEKYGEIGEDDPFYKFL